MQSEQRRRPVAIRQGMRNENKLHSPLLLLVLLLLRVLLLVLRLASSFSARVGVPAISYVHWQSVKDVAFVLG